MAADSEVNSHPVGENEGCQERDRYIGQEYGDEKFAHNLDSNSFLCLVVTGRNFY